MDRKIIKIMLFLALSLGCLKAAQIEVEAQSFHLDENAGKTTLSGNVKIKQGSDILSSNLVVIFMDKNQKPLRYEASQNAKFSIVLKGKSYKGSGDKFIYNALSDTYEINGNAFIHELESDRKLYGDKIIVDKKNNVYKVQSASQKPARFVFEVEQK